MSGHKGWGKKNHKDHSHNGSGNNNSVKCIVRGGKLKYQEVKKFDGSNQITETIIVRG